MSSGLVNLGWGVCASGLGGKVAVPAVKLERAAVVVAKEGWGGGRVTVHIDAWIAGGWPRPPNRSNSRGWRNEMCALTSLKRRLRMEAV